MRSAVVLAGGRSTRFGSTDKAFEPLAGVPMVARVAARVETVTNEVVVNCRSDQADRMRDVIDVPVSIAVDPVPDLGPVAGIKNGLQAASGKYAAVVACDMPFVDPGFVDYLFERAAGHDGAVPRPDEYYEVTQAVYRRESMATACQQALDAGERKVLAPLSYLDVVVIGGQEVATHANASTFRNVNTPAEFAAVEDQLRDDVDHGLVRDEAGEDDAVDPG